jgi:hypothetical protein
VLFEKNLGKYQIRNEYENNTTHFCAKRVLLIPVVYPTKYRF